MLEKLKERALRSFCVPQECAHAEGMVKAEQEKYLESVCISDEQQCAEKAWVAANIQGTDWPVFSSRASEYSEEREWVRARASLELTEFARQYKAGVVGEKDHTDNIQALRDILTCHFREFLHERKYRFGRAQKLLNVYLKYLWCLGNITTPPHCTFDMGIIGLSWDNLGDELTLVPPEMADDKVTWNWTQSDDVNHYLLWVSGAKSAAKKGGHCSPAEWELVEWNKRKSKEK